VTQEKVLKFLKENKLIRWDANELKKVLSLENSIYANLKDIRSQIDKKQIRGYNYQTEGIGRERIYKHWYEGYVEVEVEVNHSITNKQYSELFHLGFELKKLLNEQVIWLSKFKVLDAQFQKQTEIDSFKRYPKKDEIIETYTRILKNAA